MKKILIAMAALAAFLLPSIVGAAEGKYTVTYYCSACNSPKHSNIVSLQGSNAYVGSCASNSFPLGSYIYVEGVGTLFVNDRMKHGGMIDVYRGEYDKCECTGKFRTSAWRID